MTSERSQAYGRVMQTIGDVGTAKLTETEQERIRAAADALFFCEDVAADPDARAAVDDVTELAANLVASGRWLEESARRLLDEVLGCGPLVGVG